MTIYQIFYSFGNFYKELWDEFGESKEIFVAEQKKKQMKVRDWKEKREERRRERACAEGGKKYRRRKIWDGSTQREKI